MSQREYLKALNAEIQKLNEIIDWKIIENVDYRNEARRHKKLLRQLRSDESRRKLSNVFGILFPLWR
jgi:predicted  nucleic acid-binding Zn-ribbon protein